MNLRVPVFPLVIARGFLIDERIAQCAEMIGRMIASGTRSFSLGHLSEHNNLPELAFDTSTGYLSLLGLTEGKDYRLSVLPKVNHGEAVML